MERKEICQCRKGHNLKFTTDCTGYTTGYYLCDVCGARRLNARNGRYACVPCQYDVCLKCRPNAAKSKEKCPNNHQLVWTASHVGYSSKYYRCDICGANGLNTTLCRYACVSCQYDVCPKCRPNVAKSKEKCFNNHQLVWTASHAGYSSKYYRCDICGANSLDTTLCRYACVPCQYDVCPKCRPNVAKSKEKCSNNHQLVWTASHAGYPSKYYRCDICGANGLDTTLYRYACVPCQYDVCPKCRPGVAKSKEKCYAGHQLAWTASCAGYTSKFYKCDICAANHLDTTLYRYACVPCKYDVCPKCRPNNKNLCSKGHKLEWSKSYAGYPSDKYRCDICRARHLSTTLGRYACIQCQYDVCPSCRKCEEPTQEHVVKEIKAELPEQSAITQAMKACKLEEVAAKEKPVEENKAKDPEPNQGIVPEGKSCNICFENPVNAAFIPCGHMGACLDCCSRMQKCPFCNQPISKVLKLYMT